MRTHGQIKAWPDMRPFGFIAGTTGGPDIFVHMSDVIGADGFPPMPGESVVFDVVQTERGLRAVNVVRETGVAQ